MTKKSVIEAYKEAAKSLKLLDAYAGPFASYECLDIEARNGIDRIGIYPIGPLHVQQRNHGVHMSISNDLAEKLEAAIELMEKNGYDISPANTVRTTGMIGKKIAKRTGNSFHIYNRRGARFIDELLDEMGI